MTSTTNGGQHFGDPFRTARRSGRSSMPPTPPPWLTYVPFQRSRSTTLFLLNNAFADGIQARAHSRPPEAEQADDRVRIGDRAFSILFSRPADRDEQEIGLAYLASNSAGFRPGTPAASSCSANEFIYIDWALPRRIERTAMPISAA